MKRGISIQLCLLCMILLCGCLDGGTHGSIKSYEYPITKYELEKAVRSVINNTPTIRQEAVKDYYNDDTAYVTIMIHENLDSSLYTFRYYGNTEFWQNSKTSSIFIAYAHNKNGGGSSGNGGVKWYYFKLRKELTGVFERGFIDKLDKTLGIEHNDGDAQ